MSGPLHRHDNCRIAEVSPSRQPHPTLTQTQQSEAEGRLAGLLASAGVSRSQMPPKRKLSMSSLVSEDRPSNNSTNHQHRTAASSIDRELGVDQDRAGSCGGIERIPEADISQGLSLLNQAITDLISHALKVGTRQFDLSTAEKEHDAETRMYRTFEEADFYHSQTVKSDSDQAVAKTKRALTDKQAELQDLRSYMEKRVAALLKGMEFHIQRLVSHTVSNITQELRAKYSSELHAIGKGYADRENAALTRITHLETKLHDLEKRVTETSFETYATEKEAMKTNKRTNHLSIETNRKLNLSLDEIIKENGTSGLIPVDERPNMATSGLYTEVDNLKAKVNEIEDKQVVLQDTILSLQRDSSNISLVKEHIMDFEHEFKLSRSHLEDCMKKVENLQAAAPFGQNKTIQQWEEKCKQLAGNTNERLDSVEMRVNLVENVPGQLHDISARVSKLEDLPAASYQQIRNSPAPFILSSRPQSQSSFPENVLKDNPEAPVSDAGSGHAKPSEIKQKRDKEVFTTYGMFTPPRKRADIP